MSDRLKMLREKRGTALVQMRAIIDRSAAEKRDLTAAEFAKHDELYSLVNELRTQIDAETEGIERARDDAAQDIRARFPPHPLATLKSQARAVAEATFQLFRRQVPQHRRESTIIVPVRDDRLAPFKCGQFVMVDMAENTPHPGAIVFLKSLQTGSTFLCKVGEPCELKCGRKKILHWHVIYGQAAIYKIDGTPDPEFDGMMSGDLIPATYFKSMILGTVTGILGE